MDPSRLDLLPSIARQSIPPEPSCAHSTFTLNPTSTSHLSSLRPFTDISSNILCTRGHTLLPTPPACLGQSSALPARRQLLLSMSTPVTAPSAGTDGPARMPSVSRTGRRLSQSTAGASVARRPSRATHPPVAPLKPLTHQEALEALRAFLKERSSYDVFPVSFRLIVLDSQLKVKKALDVMLLYG